MSEILRCAAWHDALYWHAFANTVESNSLMLSKADFLIDPNVIFLNHGSYGATPREILAVQREWQDRMERQPVEFFRQVKHYMADARQALGEFVGADMNDIVFVTNSTYGVNVAAYGLGQMLRQGDELLTTDHEYGACDRAWQQYLHGVGVRVVRQHLPLPLPPMHDVTELIWAGVTDRTRVLFVSHITSPTAVCIDVKELCARARQRGIITVIDGSHAPGQIPLNLREIDPDIYTANCHKWMCTPKGSAFLYVRKEVQKYIPTLTKSWGAQGDTLRVSDFIDEHEYLGTRDVSAFLSVPTGIKWMQRNEWPTLQALFRRMRADTMDRLTSIPGIERMLRDTNDDVLQMGAVLLPQHWLCHEFKHWLLDVHRIEVMVQPWLGHGILRFSVQAHTSMSDLESLSSAVAEYEKVKRPSRP